MFKLQLPEVAKLFWTKIYLISCTIKLLKIREKKFQNVQTSGIGKGNNVKTLL